MPDEATPRSPPDVAVRRLRLEVSGVVQGVGFRPSVYRLATSLGLGGWVRNDPAGVVIEIEGSGTAVAAFRERLTADAPPLAAIETCRVSERPPSGRNGFEIRASARSDRPSALVAPDTATCADCLRELADPSDRRHRYPFINCTNCGPRFTIVRAIPYDRPYTTMAGFRMCEPCRAEYEDPLDRRFHAQPNACPDCGPSVRLLDPSGGVIEGPGGPGGASPIFRAAALIAEGAIVAVKGVGGYHLACRAADHGAVSRLRGRKHREDKPFAIMVRDAKAARALAWLDDLEAELLEGRARPIVLVRRRPGARLADQVAPGSRDVGLMLPYSPVHHLLMERTAEPLVMTSGNVSEEPIAHRDVEALQRLSPIADCFLANDRPIHTRTDDSVVRVVSVAGERRPLLLRRSRGYVPAPVPLPAPVPAPLIACGAHLKNTFTVAAGDRAWVGPHVGDLENFETLRSFEEGVDHFEALFEISPAIVAHDLHPDYLSTAYADRRAAASDLDSVAVQHHHAHLAACLADHGLGGDARALGVIFDGTGYGPDGTVWGGELLVGGARGFARLGHLWPVRLPGGEAAIRRPWRMACAWMCALTDGENEPAIPGRLDGEVDPTEWAAVVRLVRTGLASPMTTSVGRLFDAVSALCGVRRVVTYEGQAAVELEMLAAGADDPGDGAYPFPPIRDGAGPFSLDARPLVASVVSDMEAGVAPEVVARRFHHGLADGTAAVCRAEATRLGLEAVALSGGVFQNVVLLERLTGRLAEAGLVPLVPVRLPPNDGGVSYGQAVVAAAVPDGEGGAQKT